MTEPRRPNVFFLAQQNENRNMVDIHRDQAVVQRHRDARLAGIVPLWGTSDVTSDAAFRQGDVSARATDMEIPIEERTWNDNVPAVDFSASSNVNMTGQKCLCAAAVFVALLTMVMVCKATMHRITYR